MRTSIALLAVVFASSSPAAASNDCAATVKLSKLERIQKDSTNWRFTFAVDTQCEASTGGFEYTYRIAGQTNAVTKRAPDWSATDGMRFAVVDEVDVGVQTAPTGVQVLSKSLRSKKIR